MRVFSRPLPGIVPGILKALLTPEYEFSLENDVTYLAFWLARLRHKVQKPSNDAAFERLTEWLFLPEITAYAGSPFGL